VRRTIPFIEPIDTGVFILQCPNDKEKKMTVELQNQRVRVKPSYKHKEPAFDVYYQTDGSIVEAACPITLDDRNLIKSLNEQLETEMKKELESLIKKAQTEFQSDFLELGKVFMNKYPVEWKEIGPRWASIFPTVKVSIHIDGEIKDTVLLKEPTKSGGGVR